MLIFVKKMKARSQKRALSLSLSHKYKPTKVYQITTWLIKDQWLLSYSFIYKLIDQYGSIKVCNTSEKWVSTPFRVYCTNVLSLFVFF